MSRSTKHRRKAMPFSGFGQANAVLSDFIGVAFDLNLSSEIVSYQNLFIGRINSNGKKEAAKFLKALYNYAVKVSLDYIDIEPIPWTKSDKVGYPKALESFRPYLTSSNYDHRRAALTVLRQYETIYCEPEPDTVSITAPGPDPSVWDPYRIKWRKFLKLNFRKLSPQVKDERLHFTARNGPNGPAMIRAHIDALAVDQDPELKQSIFDLFGMPVEENPMVPITRLQKKTKVFESTLELGRSLKNRYNGKVQHSRLQFLADKGCKTRTIAICDFWSQDALRPLHKWAYRFLGRLKTDGTSSHNRISQILCDKTKVKRDIFCYDLSNATDRFPVFLQTEFLSEVLDESTASAWCRVISKRKFTDITTGNSLEYKCGQPMGALSSWAIFALTHHAIIEFCAYLENQNGFRDYVVIGDDVAIFNSAVASRYEKILNLLEVPISKDKSIISKVSDNSSRGEIAKRIFLNGEELSPIPTGAIHSGKKDLLLLPNLVRLCQERGVRNFFLATPVHQLCNKWYPNHKSQEAWALLTNPMVPMLRSIPDNIGSPWAPFSYEEIKLTFENFAVERFISKADQVYKDLLVEINDDPIWGGLMDDLYNPNLPLHPVNLMTRNIRDQVSQTYMDLKRSRNKNEILEIEFILDPLIRDYRRKSHRRHRIRGVLLQRTLRELLQRQQVRPNPF